DFSGNGFDAVAEGQQKPVIEQVDGRHALTFSGGENGTSYLKLPAGLLNGVNDQTGITISTWVYLKKGRSVWERIFDFGHSAAGPYVFLTRNLRGVCFLEEDLVVDAGKTYASGEWMHVAISI